LKTRVQPTSTRVCGSGCPKPSLSNVVDVTFTADMEARLDMIAEGELMVSVIDEFYTPFKKTVDEQRSTSRRVKIPEEVTDELCPECGRNLVVKHGRFGAFLGCQGYPECKFTKKIVRSTGVNCPQCGREIVERKTKKAGNSMDAAVS